MTETGQRSEVGNGTIDVASYASTDRFFGSVRRRRRRALGPIMHRYVHGGFEDTDTRFAFSFPTDGSYRGRILQPLGRRPRRS